jgi:curved DNA-binding protein CbpA
MNLNSRLFDSIRVKSSASKTEVRAAQPQCNHPGCNEPGEFRAPMGRMREGHFFQFCLEHVREYNATYNYFNGMSADDVAVYQRDALTGHRPTWSMGTNRAGGRAFREDEDQQGNADPLGVHRTRRPYADAPRKPRHGIAVLKSLGDLGLDETADAAAVKARYKDLVKRLHPDANGGDRSNEDRLREIIRAYNHLKSVKLG